MKLTIDLSPQAIKILDALVKLGIYGVTREEVAARFVADETEDRRLQDVRSRERKSE